MRSQVKIIKKDKTIKIKIIHRRASNNSDPYHPCRRSSNLAIVRVRGRVLCRINISVNLNLKTNLINLLLEASGGEVQVLVLVLVLLAITPAAARITPISNK
jgi:hypothetical protein